MGIIKAKQLVHEYIRRDEEGNVESIQTALNHIDLDVQPGQFIAILGHNGSGKSTLAKHINALLGRRKRCDAGRKYPSSAENSRNGIPEPG